jgi:uncharacterized surface protein with fasciclin (FAS1) repeats
MKIFARGAALALSLILVAAACSDDDDSSADEETTTTAEETETTEEETTTTEAETTTTEAESESETTEAAEESGTIVDVATEAGSFTTLLAAADAAGLVGTLNGEGPFTVFAPTDAAFEAALTELGLTAEELLASPDLEGILLYHVVPGNVVAADVVTLDGESVTTVEGSDVLITVDGDTVMVNEATVIQTDITASNGTIHVIDAVLIPPTS